ncbi:tetratricopeptide (TPR) repeat protein [Paenibacillus anaericanus]|uniref:Tetratricopeptide repeat protein n=1 Tax=Paenibacillus anaericanus TaxID=170367 RepID=A0A433YD16_9BACL|nr:tetratricopeptide repeat protein [Paenibacillus anaericanus]MDQ0088190.1 tetratricopeptide (TPR) repeat protein [Paenibacillus anaericanus]RUT47734.1 tetratricopeptide repeat protein [Paenibacillus anaericanus]
MSSSPICENNKTEPYRIIYLETLIRTGEIEIAFQCIQEWEKEEAAISLPFQEALRQLSVICQLHRDTNISQHNLSSIHLAELIQRTVSLGLLDIADTLLGGSPDIYLQSELIQALYEQGYVQEAKDKLSAYPINENSNSMLNLTYISAEILYDEGQYSQATELFESLLQKSPEIARARFGAASCYLNEAMSNLLRRITLYHPAEEERTKIERYLNDITQSLQIIHSSGWHTEWSLEQQRNLPAQSVSLKH